MCLSVHRRMPTLLHGPGCKLREWYGCPIVVHFLADFQGFRSYDNIQVCVLISLYTANARVPTNLENLELSGNFVNLEKSGNVL